MKVFLSKFRAFSLFVALGLLTTSVAVSFHSHKNETKISDECSLCQVGHQIRSGNISVPAAYQISFVQHFSFHQPFHGVLSAQIPLVKQSQAPPLA